MWRLAFAAVPVAALALVFVGGVASQTDSPTPTPESSPSPSPSPSPSSSPEASSTPEPLPPPPPPTPFDPNAGQPQSPSIDPSYPGTLRPGDWVQITNTESCLNMRYEPRMPAPLPDGTVHENVLNCLPDGFVGRLESYGWNGKHTLPELADGRWWWHIVGQGWAADEFLAFHHQGGLPWPERSDLANAGLIAYFGRDNSISLMNADGSNQRPIVGRAAENEYMYNLAWSPSGDQLSFTINKCCAPEAAATRIIDLNGNLIVELAGLTGARWSPDAARLSALRHHSSAGLGENSTPVVFDLNTGTETAVGGPTYMAAAPAWSPDSNQVAFVCSSSTGFTVAPDGSSIQTSLDCDGDGLRIANADGSGSRVILPMDPARGFYFGNPSWSPSGGTIAVYSMQADGGGCRGYTLVDVASGGVTGCVPLPPVAGFIGGRCGGGPEMGASIWTADGRSLVFSAQGAGQSGVFVHDIATGARTVVPSMMAGPISVAPGGAHLTFSSGHIWVAGPDGSNLTLLAEGHSPAWQP